MTKINRLEAHPVEFIPAILEDGHLYISEKYHTASHRCCCGCGLKVVTPLKPGGWALTIRHNSATLQPSIGNWGFPCKSHYWVTGGRVEWARTFSQKEIEIVRKRDQRDVEASYESRYRPQTWWQRLKNWIVSRK